MRKRILAIVLMMFILASCGEEATIVPNEIKPKYVTTAVIEEKSFGELIKLPGKISASQETSVSSMAAGTIKSVNVSVGDSVLAGQTLATIDTTTNLYGINMNNAVTSHNNALAVYNSTKTSLEKTLESAQLEYDNAKISRDNVYSSTEKQLELAQAQLDAVITQKGNTDETSTTSLELAQKSLENAKLNLENYKKNYEETLIGLDDKKASLLKNIKVAIEGSSVLFSSTLTEIDKILGITDLNKNYSENFSIYIGAKNSSIKSDAIDLFHKSNQAYQSVRNNYENASNLSEVELVNLMDSVLSEASKMIILLDKMTQVLDNSVTSPALSDSSLSSMKTMMNSSQTQFSSLKSNLTGLSNNYSDTINGINSTNTTKNTQIASLEQAISVAQATYDNTRASINTSIDTVSSSENTTRIQYESTAETARASRETADNSLKIAENRLTSAKANYDAQLASLKAQVDTASGQMNSLGQQLSNSEIKAPYDGIIISKSIEVGSNIGQGSIAFILANSDQKIVKMDVNSENVKDLSIGKEVSITKNDLTSLGYITLVGVGANDNSMYPVEVRIENKDFANGVVLGDFIDVNIEKDIGTEKHIIVPFSSLVTHSQGIYSVYVIGQDNIVEERNVEIGASNSNEVIIKSGLKVGEKIVVNGALNITNNDKIEER